MGFFGRLFGENDDDRPGRQQPPVRPNQRNRSDDEIAVERYRYLLRTAPPDAIEQVHEEAFAALTPEQRRMVFEELKAGAAPTDQPAHDDPRSLARAATRSELRQPGFMDRTFGGGMSGGFGYGGGGYLRSGPSFGSMLGGSLLGSIAGVVIGSAIADAVLPGIGDLGNDMFAGGPDMGADLGGYDGAGYDGNGYDGGAEQAGFDGGSAGGGDWFGGGSDFGGGGDFGGGDFGGGMDI